jgi:hypothetical protein
MKLKFKDVNSAERWYRNLSFAKLVRAWEHISIELEGNEISIENVKRPGTYPVVSYSLKNGAVEVSINPQRLTFAKASEIKDYTEYLSAVEELYSTITDALEYLAESETKKPAKTFKEFLG